MAESVGKAELAGLKATVAETFAMTASLGTMGATEGQPGRRRLRAQLSDASTVATDGSDGDKWDQDQRAGSKRVR